MGTRCLTFVYEESKTGDKPEAIINLYRQFDGYPTGHGAELAQFLNGGKLVNGISLGNNEVVFNGMGCLAAQLVAYFKQEAGNFYLYPVTAEDCGQDFEYHIYMRNGLISGQSLRIKVMDCGCNFFGGTQDETYEPIFDGSLEEFTEFCKEKEEA